jgi:DNA-binding response OmpR family regulator
MKNSILLVEDELLISKALKRSLERLGFQVTTAATVEAGLLKSAKNRFDVIVTEFNVRSQRRNQPRAGNGLNFIRKIRANSDCVPILVYTAMAGESYEQAAAEAGADGFLSQKNGLSQLLSMISESAKSHRQRPQSSLDQN